LSPETQGFGQYPRFFLDFLEIIRLKVFENVRDFHRSENSNYNINCKNNVKPMFEEYFLTCLIGKFYKNNLIGTSIYFLNWRFNSESKV
jgi:hypothetical protein